MKLTSHTDSITRCVNVRYEVPLDAPDIIHVACEWASDDGDWTPAPVLPHMSDTAKRLMTSAEWDDSVLRGCLIERFAAGTTRTVVLNPFCTVLPSPCPIAFRIRLRGDQGQEIAESVGTIALKLDNVLVANDWEQLMQEPSRRQWQITSNNDLVCPKKGISLPQLTYPLNLRGQYAIFVSLPPGLGAIELRLSGDNRYQYFENHRAGELCLWRWADMSRQHLVIRQPHRSIDMHEDAFRAHLSHVRFVPLSNEQLATLEHSHADSDRKLVIGYNEPYSWAFYENVQSNLQFREPLEAFQDARIGIVDANIGRLGMKAVFETRKTEQLLGSTHGDDVRGVMPVTDNVGCMMQFTNPLQAQIEHAEPLGMTVFANMGATRCYVGTDLEGAFSIEHPTWRVDDYLDYSVPEVRAHALSLIAEALEVGASGISIGWCRYPYALRDAGVATDFFRELRQLANNAAGAGAHIPILAHFPGTGVPMAEFMDYQTWINEELVDILCPGTIYQHGDGFGVEEYIEAAAESGVRVCPAINCSLLDCPGAWMQRLHEFYTAGANGAYFYQCDLPVLMSAAARRALAIAGSPQAIATWLEHERGQQNDYRRDIYRQPSGNAVDTYGTARPLKLWVEGITPKTVQFNWDSGHCASYTKPPYLWAFNAVEEGGIPSGKRQLRVRAEDNDGQVIERAFAINVA